MFKWLPVCNFTWLMSSDLRLGQKEPGSWAWLFLLVLVTLTTLTPSTRIEERQNSTLIRHYKKNARKFHSSTP